MTISPIVFEAVQKFDAIFALERSINGSSPEQRLAARREDIASLVTDLIDRMKQAGQARPSMRNGSSLGAIALSRPHALQVGFHHFRDELIDLYAMNPAQFALGLGRIAE